MKRIWYAYLKFSVFLTTLVYFRQVERNGRSNVPGRGPLLMGVRHSNALMDPLMSGVYVPRVLHFLVRSDVFKNPWAARLWASMNMMPIYRIRDGRDALGKNGEIFEKCHHILRKGGGLEIFPEGTHSGRHALQPIKKGAARIALGALDGMTREEDIAVLPVGLNYNRERAFRGKLSVNYGPVISTRPYYHPADPLAPAAVAELTRRLEEEMRKTVLDVRDPEHYEELNGMREALEIHCLGIRIPGFALSKRLADGLNEVAADPARAGSLYRARARQLGLLKKMQLPEQGVPGTPVKSGQVLGKLLLNLPFLLLLPLGALLHAPMLIPAARSHRLLNDPIFFAALRFITGMFLGQILYLIVFGLGWGLSGSLLWGLAGLGGTVVCGIAAIAGWDAWVDLRRLWRFHRAEGKFPEDFATVRELQKEVMGQLPGSDLGPLR